MNVNLERIKELTLAKIEEQNHRTPLPFKKIVLAVALVATSSVLLVGAAKLFDWKVMVNGKVQQGNYGDTIVVGDGFAAMSPQKDSPAGAVVITTVFPDQTPDRVANPGELSLFGYKSEDGSVLSRLIGVAGEPMTDLAQIKQLAQGAEAVLHWPALVSEDYKLLDSYICYYTKKEQISRSELLYSSFGQWKCQQLFLLPAGYQRFLELMNLRLATPDGKEFNFVSHLSATDSQVYGSGGDCIIEPLEMDGYQSVVFVSDAGWNQLYAWKKIPKIRSVDPLTFGENDRTQNDMLYTPHCEDTVYGWRQYSFDSNSLSKEELVQLLRSIDLTA